MGKATESEMRGRRAERMARLALVASVIVLGSVAFGACDSATSGPDAGGQPDGGARMDAEVDADAAVDVDAGAELDASVDGGAAPDAGAPEPCESPGEVEAVACGACGTTDRFCTVDLVWSYGLCEDEGECTPGGVDRVACGDCGTRAARCTSECGWELTGDCEGEGECTPGTASRTSEGCPDGESRPLSCTDACAFDAGECEPDECAPGETTTVTCGMCGTRVRTCDASRRWVDGLCTGEGVCAPGTTGEEPCGFCGTSSARCNATCGWELTGSCAGAGTCAPGTPTTCTTTCGSTGTASCTASCAPDTCVAPAEICNGVDDDCDTMVDEGCGCSLPGSDCSSSELCACPSFASSCSGTGACVPLFGNDYAIRISSAVLPVNDPAGECWDGFCVGDADPYVQLLVDGVLIGTTASRPDTRLPVWSAEVFRAALNNGSVVRFNVYDEDVTVPDFAFTCSLTVTAAVLRARTFACNAGTDQRVSGSFAPYP